MVVVNYIKVVVAKSFEHLSIIEDVVVFVWKSDYLYLMLRPFQ